MTDGNATDATEPATRRSADELAELKAFWLEDPCWELEGTRGFEAHHTELYVFRLEHEIDGLRKQLSEVRTFREQLARFVSGELA